jgi:hypothetical protein
LCPGRACKWPTGIPSSSEAHPRGPKPQPLFAVPRDRRTWSSIASRMRSDKEGTVGCGGRGIYTAGLGWLDRGSASTLQAAHARPVTNTCGTTNGIPLFFLVWSPFWALSFFNPRLQASTLKHFRSGLALICARVARQTEELLSLEREPMTQPN